MRNSIGLAGLDKPEPPNKLVPALVAVHDGSSYFAVLLDHFLQASEKRPAKPLPAGLWHHRDVQFSTAPHDRPDFLATDHDRDKLKAGHRPIEILERHPEKPALDDIEDDPANVWH